MNTYRSEPREHPCRALQCLRHGCQDTRAQLTGPRLTVQQCALHQLYGLEAAVATPKAEDS